MAWAVLGPAPARACGACQDDFSTVAPGARALALPANAVLLVSGRGLDAGSISVAGGADGGAVAVPFTVEAAGDATGARLVRVQWPLGREGQLTLTSNLGSSLFGIGPGQDHIAPAAPQLAGRSLGRADACCPNVVVGVTGTGGLDDDGAPAQVLKLQVSSAAGRRVALFRYRPAVEEALGSSAAGCLGSDPLAVDGEAVEVTATVLDWAGNESPAAAPVALTFRKAEPGGCPAGCSIPAAEAGSSGWLLLLASLSSRSRRSRRRTTSRCS